MAPVSRAVLQGIRIAGQLKACTIPILLAAAIACPFEESETHFTPASASYPNFGS
jgi:hypothetical protein